MTARLLVAVLALALLACGDDGGTPSQPAPDTAADPVSDATDDPADDAGPARDEPDPIVPFELVDLFVGTGAELINFGALFPGAAMPFGMTKLSPDTEGTVAADFGVLHAGGYFYDDTDVMGFSLIHLVGVGVADYGNLLVTPVVGDPAEVITAADVPNLPLDHDLEHAEPGYYRLEVAEPAMRAELTVTERAAVHRYTFPDTPNALLAVDITHALGKGEVTSSDLTIDPATGRVSGFLHNYGEFTSRFDGFDLFFVIDPAPAPTSVGTFDDAGYHEGATTAGGTRAGAVLRWDTTGDAPDEVVLRVGISFVDGDGALANLEAEATGRSFDDVRAAARAAWEDALGVIEVEGGTDTRQRLLYTALYHAQLMPTLFTDVDGRYRGLDKEVHEVEPGMTYYTDFSMWDTYRTFHPLASLLLPDLQRDFLRSLVLMAEQGGTMPVWPLAIGYTGSMIGTSADIVFGDAYDKGFTDVDVDAAYEAMRALATAPAPPGKPGRDDIELCHATGWCPAEVDGSVSKTLEYSADDYCLAQLATSLGHADDAAMFLARSSDWKNHWDDSEGFLAPRWADGTFAYYSQWTRTDAYIEGTPWHYLFMVPHDVPGLVELMGGTEGFLDRLTTFMQGGRDEFSMLIPTPYYWHGNEPDIVAPWLFGYGGRPDLTRWWTTWVADTAYLLEPGGLAGNDDGGTLSSWYLFAAAGFYPLPCTGQYLLSAPLFDEVVWHLESGDLEVHLGDDPTADPLVDGEPWSDFHLPHSAIAEGAVLTLPPPP